jgi:hypothetical protein
LAEIYGPVSIIPPTNPTQQNEQEPELLSQTHQDQEQEFEFRLFSTPTIKDGNGTQTKAQKIVLREPEEKTGEGAFIIPRRDRKFYISEKAQGPELLRYQASAVSGEGILKARKKRAWGLEAPWRVTILLSTTKPIPSSKSGSREAREDGKKTKPNKKRRIILRERRKKKDSAEEVRRREREEREEKEREKKTRRNREKKVKRKLKEKAKKASGGGVEGEVVVENGNGSGGTDS